MQRPNADELLWFVGHWWSFPGAQIGMESEFEWRDGKAYLLEPDGSALEGIVFVDEAALDWRQNIRPSCGCSTKH